MKSDIEYPRLVPPDDSMPGQGGLLRSPLDLPADQFSLLAAAWAEGALSGESLIEVESVLTSDSEKRAFAESFRRLRLKPGTEKWEGRNKLLRSTPMEKNIRRMLIVTIATAAATLSIITLRPVTDHQAVENTPLVLPGLTVTAETAKPASPEIQVASETPPVESHQTIPGPATLIASAEAEVVRGDEPLVLGAAAETPLIISQINTNDLIALQIRDIPPPAEVAAERSWIVNSLAALSRTGTKEEKPVDGYNIAGSVVKSVNTLLGWEMELEKVSTDQGEPVALSFSSGLLTISSPVKKSNQ